MSEIRSYIDELLKPRFRLNDTQCAQFATYYELLVDWNTRMNLTAITEPKDVVIKHFYDSLLLTEDVSLVSGQELVDVGTGAGFPGIPLAIVCPGLQVDLLDSLRKRVGFLRTVIDALGLEDSVSAYHDRAELFAKQSQRRDSYDWVTARAVARLPLLSEYCLPFLRPSGTFIACKGPNGAAELDEAAYALSALAGQHRKTCHHELPDGEIRDILLIQKIAPTPKRFPRNPGAAAKAPLLKKKK